MCFLLDADASEQKATANFKLNYYSLVLNMETAAMSEIQVNPYLSRRRHEYKFLDVSIILSWFF